MDLDRLDLHLPATVHWRNPPPHQPQLGAHTRRFASVANAIRFVMDDLTDFPQLTASISTQGRELTFQQIRLLYSRFR
jgi:hypothetical protein